MSGLLASVRSVDEAEIARREEADIIDLKDPDHGALAALPAAIIAEAVAWAPPSTVLSATAGDLCEMVELPQHPWFFGCQFHPEFTSNPRRGHPLFTALGRPLIAKLAGNNCTVLITGESGS